MAETVDRLRLESTDPVLLMREIGRQQADGWKVLTAWKERRGFILWRHDVFIVILIAAPPGPTPDPEPDGLAFIIGPVREQRP